MFETIRKNGKLIEKLIVNQIGMTMFGNVLYIAASAAGQKGEGIGTMLKIGTSIFAIGFYLVLLYFVGRDEGMKDAVKIDTGKMKNEPQKFIILSLTANILNIVVGIFFAVVGFIILSGAQTTQALSNAAYIGLWYFRIAEGMYTGVWIDLLSRNSFVPLLILIPSIIAPFLGYVIGTKGGLKYIIINARKARENGKIEK